MNRVITPFLFAIIIIQSCEEKVDRSYVLENDTNYSIRIEFYKRNASNVASKNNTVILEEMGDSFKKDYNEEMASNVNAHRVLNADSIVVTYEDAKVEYYSLSDKQDKNILYNQAYIKDNETYRYKFTEQDYENAEEIGG